MLVLARKCGESIIIDGRIEIKITEILGDKVRIGIDAPREVVVLRKELLQTMESNREAAEVVATKDFMSFFAGLKPEK